MVSRIEQLIGEIEEFIDGCKLQPFSSTKIIVDKTQLEELLVELRHRTPDEIKKYQKVLNNKEAIINDAKAQAEAIISAANVQTSEMVNDSEITRQAREKANELIESARKEAEEILNKAVDDANTLRSGAFSYIQDMFSDAEQSLSQMNDTLKEKTSSLLDSIQSSVDTIHRDRQELIASGNAESRKETEEIEDDMD